MPTLCTYVDAFQWWSQCRPDNELGVVKPAADLLENDASFCQVIRSNGSIKNGPSVVWCPLGSGQTWAKPMRAALSLFVFSLSHPVPAERQADR